MHRLARKVVSELWKKNYKVMKKLTKIFNFLCYVDQEFAQTYRKKQEAHLKQACVSLLKAKAQRKSL